MTKTSQDTKKRIRKPIPEDVSIEFTLTKTDVMDRHILIDDFDEMDAREIWEARYSES